MLLDIYKVKVKLATFSRGWREPLVNTLTIIPMSGIIIIIIIIIIYIYIQI